MEKEVEPIDLEEFYDIQRKPGDRRWKAASIILAIMLVSVAAVGGFVYSELKKVQADHEQLQSGYDSLSVDHSTLEVLYESLHGQYDNLSADYQKLQADNADLLSQYSQLDMNYSLLNDSYNQLQDSYELMAEQYSSIIESVLSRHGGQQYARQFVTPNDPTVVSNAQRILDGGYNGELTWDDMDKINKWIHVNVVYNSDTDPTKDKDEVWAECWLYPSETLENLRGDCEDQALLFTSMCLAEQSVGYVYCAVMVLDGVGHMAIFINVEGDTMVVYDPVSGYRSPYSMSESTCMATYAAAHGIGNIQVISVFNQQVYQSFGSNQEFYSWF